MYVFVALLHPQWARLSNAGTEVQELACDAAPIPSAHQEHRRGVQGV